MLLRELRATGHSDGLFRVHSFLLVGFVRQRMRPNACRPGETLAAGFRFRLIFGSRGHRTQTRIANLAGEFPFLVVDAPTDRTHLFFNGNWHGPLRFQFVFQPAFRVPNKLDRAQPPLAVCHNCAG